MVENRVDCKWSSFQMAGTLLGICGTNFRSLKSDYNVWFLNGKYIFNPYIGIDDHSYEGNHINATSFSLFGTNINKG